LILFYVDGIPVCAIKIYGDE